MHLRNAGGHGGKSAQFKARDTAAIGHHFALALRHVNQHASLIVLGRGEHFRGARRNGAVAHDEFCEGAALGFNSKAERNHIQQQQIRASARQNTGLHRGAKSHHLIGIKRGVGSEAGVRGHLRANIRNARGSTNQNNSVNLDIARRMSGIGARVGERLERACDQRRDHVLKLRARELTAKDVVGVGGRCHWRSTRIKHRATLQFHAGVKLNFNRGFLVLRKRALGVLGHHANVGDVACGEGGDVQFIFDFGLRPQRDQLIKVVAAQTRVAAGGKHLKRVAHGWICGVHGLDAQNGNIESAAAQVVHGHGFAAHVGGAINSDGFAQRCVSISNSIGQRGGGWLIHDSLHGQSAQTRGVAGGLALCVVKICGHGDHGARDRCVKARLRNAAKFRQHHGGYFLGRNRGAANIESGESARTLHKLRGHFRRNVRALRKSTAHETFCAGDGGVGELRGFIFGLPTHARL